MDSLPRDRMPKSPGPRREAGAFAGFVLLDAPQWDPDRFCDDWGREWQTPVDWACKDGTLIGEIDGMTAAVSLMPAPVPGGEAERNAATNYLWPQAAETARNHVAHLLVAVLPRGGPALEAGQLFVQLGSTCLAQPHALGFYASGTVFEPGFYREAAGVIRSGDLPLLNWVFIGLCRTRAGVCAYTSGMTAFGKREMEVLNSQAAPEELRDFLLDIVHYVLSGDVTLQDGETIGFSAEQKLPITLSEGMLAEGDSLKIAYLPAD